MGLVDTGDDTGSVDTGAGTGAGTDTSDDTGANAPITDTVSSSGRKIVWKFVQ